MMTTRSILSVLAAAATFCAAARADVGAALPASTSHIALPRDGDEFSSLVARAAVGNETVDFRALRFAYLKSAARKRSSDEDLRGELFQAAKAQNDARVRATAEKLLSVNYADLDGQNLLSMACEHLHDQGCAKQAGFMAFGLFKSILESGDGKTCKTGWEVATVREEYVVLGVLAASPRNQSLIMGPPSCDALEATDKDGKPATYFFRIDAILEDERSMFETPKKQ
jgi:hypothetical protein